MRRGEKRAVFGVKVIYTCDYKLYARAGKSDPRLSPIYKAVPRSKLSRILSISSDLVTKRKRDVLFRVLVEISADLHISRRPVSQCATSQLTFLLNTLFRSLIYVTASSESSFFFLFVLPILRVSYR